MCTSNHYLYVFLVLFFLIAAIVQYFSPHATALVESAFHSSAGARPASSSSSTMAPPSKRRKCLTANLKIVESQTQDVAGMEVENVGGQQEEEEKEEDDLNISSDDSSSDDSSSDDSSSDNNSSRGVRWRPREQVEAKEGPKELTEERRKQLAAAGKIGGEESTSLRLRPSFIRDREDTSGRFVLETLAHRIDRLTRTGGRKTKLGVKERKKFRSREKRRRDKEAKEDERGEDDFATAYAVLLEIHRNGTLDPSKHIYTDPDAMRAAGLEPRAADDFGRGKLLLPYKLRHAGLYRVHDLIKKGMDPTEAFKNVAVVFSVSERTLRTWKNEFYLNGFLFRRLLSGLHEGKTFSEHVLCRRGHGACGLQG